MYATLLVDGGIVQENLSLHPTESLGKQTIGREVRRYQRAYKWGKGTKGPA